MDDNENSDWESEDFDKPFKITDRDYLDPFHENEDFDKNMADNNCISIYQRGTFIENDDSEQNRCTLPTSTDEPEEG